MTKSVENKDTGVKAGFAWNPGLVKRVLTMLVSVISMGMCISLLWIVDMGTDSCTTMNQSVANVLGMSFGSYQLTFNIVMLMFVFCMDKKLIGLGTIGNMVLVGYSADFFSFVWSEIVGIPEGISFGARIGILLPTTALFVFSAAVYMNSGLGTAPFDALPFLIHQKLTAPGRLEKLNFRVTRTCWDALATLVGVLAGGRIGAMTVLVVAFMGTAVEWVGRKWKIG